MDHEKTRRRCKGEGSISFRKDIGKWMAQYSLGHDESGNRIRKTVYGKTKKEAYEKLKEIKRHYENSAFLDNGSGTLNELIDEWLKVKRNTVKPKSYDSIEEVMRNCVKPTIGFIQMQNLNSQHIQDLIFEMREKGVSYSRIKKVYNNLNNCFVWAAECKKISGNPASGVLLPSEKEFVNAKSALDADSDDKDCKYYTKDELKKIFSSATECYPNGTPIYRLGWAYVLLANTGMRAGELCALTWDDVDFDNRTIRINKNLVYATDPYSSSGKKSAIIQKTTKTKRSTRCIPITVDSEKALTELKKISGDSRFVISAKTGSLWTANSLDHTFRRILDRAGLRETKNYGVHSLRHSFATILLLQKVDVKIVSDILGHCSTAVTQDIYQHVIQETKQATMVDFPSLIK